MSTEQTLAKLNGKYAGSAVTALANDGKWAEAADLAGRSGMWGLWSECRIAGGMNATDDDRAALLAAITAARKSKFAR